jgi:CRISPR-associated endonuclease/helicase Cas3
MAHRIDTLKKINNCLASDPRKPVFCISTQLVEAGVDFSFGCVMRIVAGMENHIQSAGRCNRNGEFGHICPVYILNYSGEDLSHLKEIKNAQHASESVLYSFKNDPSRFNNDLSSSETITAYYKRLYADMREKECDFFSEKQGTSIYAMLSSNPVFKEREKAKTGYIMPQAFRTAGDEYKVFDDNTQDVLVPYGDGEECITNLSSQQALSSFEYRAKVLADAKRFSISLFDYEIKALLSNNRLVSICDGTVYALQPEYYDSNTGFVGISGDSSSSNFWEVRDGT